MSRPNPTWLQGKRKPRQKVSDRWYIRLNDKFGVMADRYNLILAETGTFNGKAIPWGRAYTQTFTHMAEVMTAKGISALDITTFKERTNEFSTEMKDGRIVVLVPEGFVMDESPFKEEVAA